jgi:hypothetical protein
VRLCEERKECHMQLTVIQLLSTLQWDEMPGNLVIILQEPLPSQELFSHTIMSIRDETSVTSLPSDTRFSFYLVLGNCNIRFCFHESATK